MANDVKITLTGDASKLEAEFKRAQSRADALAQELDHTGKSFDKAGEAFDEAETRAQGVADAVTGTTDTLMGLSQIAKGDATTGLYLLSTGAADLASSMTNTVVPALKSGVQWIKNLDKATKRTLVGVVLAVAAAAAAFLIFRDNADDAGDSVGDLNKDIEVFIKTGGELTGELRRGTHAIFGIADALSKNALTADASEQAYDALDKQLVNLLNSGADYNDILQIEGVQQALLNGHLDDFQSAAADAIERQNVLNDSSRIAAQRWEDARGSLEDYANLLREQTDPVFAFRQAQKRLADATTAVSDAESEFGRNSEQYEDATWNLVEAKLGLQDAAVKAASADTDQLIPALQELADQGVITSQDLQRIVSKLQEAKNKADILDGTRVKITYDEYFNQHGYSPLGHGAFSGKASGGPVKAGTPYVVGEEGPELFMPSSNGTIIPNDKMAGGSSWSGGTTVNVYVDGVKTVQKYVRNNGGNVQTALGR